MDIKELNDRQHRKQRQLREARLEIVAQLYKRGYSVRKIAKEVQARLQLEKLPNPSTIQSDIKKLLNEWREYRLDNIEDRMQLELERIDDCIIELWSAWEKSKTDYTQEQAKQKGSPIAGDKKKKHSITEIEQQRKEIRKFGDVSYITEIRQQLAERRKLLGLYAPDKREVTGANGTPLNPANAQSKLNIEDLSEEELTTLYKIAAKRDKKEQ
jgi:hypothetical protein